MKVIQSKLSEIAFQRALAKLPAPCRWPVSLRGSGISAGKVPRIARYLAELCVWPFCRGVPAGQWRGSALPCPADGPDRLLVSVKGPSHTAGRGTGGRSRSVRFLTRSCKLVEFGRRKRNQHGDQHGMICGRYRNNSYTDGLKKRSKLLEHNVSKRRTIFNVVGSPTP